VIFAIDIGNSQTVLGLLEDREVRHHWRLATEPNRTSDELSLQLGHLLRLGAVDAATVEGSVLSSVVPPLGEVWRQAIDRTIGSPPLVLSAQMPLPMELAVDHPEEVGTDRIANAVAGRERFGAPVLVVDSGTAATIDVVGPEGSYRGGVILPGPEIAAEALSRRTAALPLVTLDRPARVIGANTVACMRSGLFHGFLGAIEHLVDAVRAELDAPDCPAVATGGLGELLARESDRVTSHLPWLTLEGLAALWEFSQRRT
jgi:type III pantothenate kinase